MPEVLLVKGATLVDAGGSRRADVAIRDGLIAAVAPEIETGNGVRVLDGTGCTVAPGLVDLHTHLREPGREDAETIESGSRAAALGGYTAVVAMPNTDPT
ncbi:MAG TPA: dihydroorotase family protein, partial [Acidimicrobiales bacterium]|nr:dihydroorotase family protein [Acidimicrobiales bacterium]